MERAANAKRVLIMLSDPSSTTPADTELFLHLVAQLLPASVDLSFADASEWNLCGARRKANRQRAPAIDGDEARLTAKQRKAAQRKLAAVWTPEMIDAMRHIISCHRY